jgi:hypothetical protein
MKSAIQYATDFGCGQHGHSIIIASYDWKTKDTDEANVAARSAASDSIHMDRRIRRQREW